MPKEMLINVSEGEECRIALVENGRLEELYMERTSATSHVGNIYKGRVTNVEASIQAAFVDFGLGRNGFLHISDLMPSYFGRGGDDVLESVGRKLARRDRPPIQRCLRRGDEIIVQIIKEGIGTKGPTLSTYISIPGRILVMMPGMSKFGVSRKIEDEDERRRLRQILDSLKPIDDVGFIIRTAGIDKTKAEIQRDLTYLTRLWQNIERKRREKAPVELYTEGDLVTRTVRDVFSADLDRIVVDNEEVAKRIKEFFKIAMPRAKCRIELYEGPVPIFHQAGLEREIELMYSRHVPLPSGGSLVIDSTEAVVAIDVNSGKFRDHNDAETTAFKTDLEAADEIPRQLKLRDLGGVIICDFIDLRFERHRRELEKRLHDNFKNDRAKTKVLRMSQFGIIELTRQRMRPSLKRSIYFDCPHCKGAGLVKTPESMSLDVMRRLAIAAHDPRVHRVELTVSPDVGVYVVNKKRAQLAALEALTKKRLIVRQDALLGLDEVKFNLFDSREGNLFLEELGMEPGEPADRRPGQQGRNGSRDSAGRDGAGRDAARRPPQGRPQPGQRHGPPGEEDDLRDDLDSAEDAVEDRELSRELPGGVTDLTAPLAGQPARPVPRLPLGRVVGRLIEVDPPEPEESSSVIEVDEPNEPIGDGPEPYDEDMDDRRPADRRPPERRPPDRRPPDRHLPDRYPPDRRPPNMRSGDDRGPQRRDVGPRGQDRYRDDGGGRDSRNADPRNLPPRGINPRDVKPGFNQGQPPRPLPVPPIGPGAPLADHGYDGPPEGPEPGNALDDDGQPRRRRRRRGRRGRGRGRFDREGEPISDRRPDQGPPPPGGYADQGEGPGADAEGHEDGYDNREEITGEERGNLPVEDSLLDAEGREERSELLPAPEPIESDLEPIAREGEPDSAESDESAETAEAREESADGAGPKRRRRRGGRRHRRRSGAAEGDTRAPDGDAGGDADATEESPSAEAPIDEPTTEVEAKPTKTRRKRATAPKTVKKPSRRKLTTAELVEQAKDAAAEQVAENVAVAPATPVARSGSTDRHLVIDDVPVDPEPVRRPRSVRDLDEVPDDFD
jgi:ribonuclease E